MAIIQRGALEATIASYTGTGANVNLDLGFIPAHAQALDVTSGANQWWWNSGFSSTTAAASQTIWGVIATSDNSSAAVLATITNGAGGILPLDGSTGSGIGLVIGTNTVINVSGHGYIVTAWQLH